MIAYIREVDEKVNAVLSLSSNVSEKAQNVKSKKKRGDLLDRYIPNSTIAFSSGNFSFVTCYKVHCLIKERVWSSGSSRMKYAVSFVTIAVIFSLPTDKTIDMYHQSVGLDHCEFLFSVMTGTVLNVQHDLFDT